jgi:hypothetical protein
MGYFRIGERAETTCPADLEPIGIEPAHHSDRSRELDDLRES